MDLITPGEHREAKIHRALTEATCSEVEHLVTVYLAGLMSVVDLCYLSYRLLTDGLH